MSYEDLKADLATLQPAQLCVPGRWIDQEQRLCPVGTLAVRRTVATIEQIASIQAVRDRNEWGSPEWEIAHRLEQDLVENLACSYGTDHYIVDAMMDDYDNGVDFPHGNDIRAVHLYSLWSVWGIPIPAGEGG